MIKLMSLSTALVAAIGGCLNGKSGPSTGPRSASPAGQGSGPCRA